MSRNADKIKFRNEDLVLKISNNLDRTRYDESKYEAFLDELCKDREYQKEAIQVSLRYFLGGEYADLRDLAKRNFEDNEELSKRYGSWISMERHLQLPDQLSASIDLATGTGKSFVLYGVSVILLSEGVVDRVLVLCPSTTIEAGLLEKFRSLAANSDLRALLPSHAKIFAPSIINASQSITEGCICVENYHAILEHVGSSIKTSLTGKGSKVAVLNDEAHHIANEAASKVKKWKEFLSNPDFGFKYVLGVSGTCYVEDEYFADVIFRYSLRRAIEEKYVKKVEYVAEMPKTGDPDEKWQLIYNRHDETKKKLSKRNINPITIIVTPTIAKCKDVAEDLSSFLIDNKKFTREQIDDQILVVYNNAPGVVKLPLVDRSDSKVEWIIAVSMLNEGWDVKRVFQIVPHEEKAFNSKLLIAQVLGRGLRVPEGWMGEQPQVVIFNHDAWAPRIKHLVNEILEIEKKITSCVIDGSTYHFDLTQIDYTLDSTSVTTPMTGEYELFSKGYVDLATETPSEDVSIEFERASTGERYKWQTTVQHKTYSPHDIAIQMYQRLEDAEEADDFDKSLGNPYTTKFPIDKLETIIIESLTKIGTTVATESMKQKFLQSLGTLRRKAAETVRYTPIVDRYRTISTKERPGDSVSAGEMRSTKTVFYTDATRNTLTEEQVEFFDEATEPGSGYKCAKITNRYDFKTPLNLAIADYENERRFINMLVQPENIQHYKGWIKSTANRFYEIDYAWKKGDHPKRGKFNPDFFIRTEKNIIVVEIKDEDDLKQPSDENRKKNEYALSHFERVNNYLKKNGTYAGYKFNFLTPRSYNKFFQSLRQGTIENFRSELDVKLLEE